MRNTRVSLALLPLLGALAAAAPAHADAICGGSVTVSRAGAIATCAYTNAGETPFTVPDGVTALEVVAVGGRGANGLVGDGFSSSPGLGGAGALVSATLAVTPGDELYVEVGAPGQTPPNYCDAGLREGGPGGANGGGPGGLGRCFGYGGGGGGGASDVRTTPAADGGLTGLPGDPRLVVAGGGGGGASSLANPAGSGGDAGGAGAGAGLGGDCAPPGGDGGPGGAGGVGGGGGAAGACDASGTSGTAGTGGTGGDGFAANSGGGGGGGGGYVGGGAGGASTMTGSGSGGGAGSSFGPPGTLYATAGVGLSASVTLTFEIPSPTVAISAPVDGESFLVGTAATTSFSCADSLTGPGIASCLDGDGRASGAALDTSTVGPHTLTVTATSADGRTATRSVSYTVEAAPFFPWRPIVPEPAPTPDVPSAPSPLPVVTVHADGATDARASRRGRVVVPGVTATCTAGAGPCDDASAALNATVDGRRVTLGRSVFRLADGASSDRIAVTLSNYGRRTIERERSLVVTAVVTLRNSATTRTAIGEREFRLRQPNRR